MRGAVLYGLLLGTFGFVMQSLPQPMGMMIYWAVLAVQLGFASLVIWRRTGMSYLASVLLLGSVTSALMVVLLSRWGFFLAIPLPWFGVIFLFMAITLVLLHLERQASPRRWTAWKAHTKNASVLDFLTLRHIPHLRGLIR